MRHLKRQEGFTLLELLMVVIIIAILASLALPQYFKVTERARMSEAIDMLGQLRSSQIRYRAEFGVYSGDLNLTNLDLDPTDMAGDTAFTYANSGNDTTLSITAARDLTPPVPGFCIPNYELTIDEGGMITGRDCQSALGGGS